MQTKLFFYVLKDIIFPALIATQKESHIESSEPPKKNKKKTTTMSC